MKDDTYQITKEATELFHLLPECDQRKIIDYLRVLVTEPASSSVVPVLASESTP